MAPDFRHPKGDARLSLAYLCALQGQLGEARKWFAASRTVLDEQGARPLRAIVDFDEAWALVRPAGLPLTDPAFPPAVHAEVEGLLHAALVQFEAIGMPGWARRVEALRSGRPVIERQQEPSGSEGAVLVTVFRACRPRGTRWSTLAP